MDTERIFDLLQTHGVQLARIEALQEMTKEHMDHLIPVVAEHSKQLGMMKGIGGVLALLWSGLVAVFAATIKAHH
jgi:hypothetical protein